VLGLGNLLLSDDGVGLRLLEELSSSKAAVWGKEVEFLDGGTQGLALIGEFGARRGVVILDAVRTGTKPGTVHVFRALSGPYVRSTTAHEGNARELMATAALLGESPDHLAVVGVEPGRLDTGIGLSDSVERVVNVAVQRAAEEVEQILAQT